MFCFVCVCVAFTLLFLFLILFFCFSLLFIYEFIIFTINILYSREREFKVRRCFFFICFCFFSLSLFSLWNILNATNPGDDCDGINEWFLFLFLFLLSNSLLTYTYTQNEERVKKSQIYEPRVRGHSDRDRRRSWQRWQSEIR